jgi:hypothetical protein
MYKKYLFIVISLQQKYSSRGTIPLKYDKNGQGAVEARNFMETLMIAKNTTIYDTCTVIRFVS